MKRFLLHLAILIWGSAASAQQVCQMQKSVEVDLVIIQTKLLNKDLFGANCSLTYFPKKHAGFGFYFVYAQKQIADTFGYVIHNPIIQYFEMGLTSQYNFIETNHIRLNGRLLNGFVQSRLGDNAIKEKLHKNRPKEITSNYYYVLQPGMGMSFNLTPKKHECSLWITAESLYRFCFGKSRFANNSQFSGYSIGIGITLLGFDH